jgi:tRNA 5-methylaminomethyl-2-thiouridine biosynthesis bifunctional protein
VPRLDPAEIEFGDDGTPRSPRYDDVYHSADSGPGQARHVFLGGNALPGRWAGRRDFTILELGFGLGVNFLATWRAWRDDPARPRTLHYVAIDRHPPAPDALRVALARYGEFADLARELVDRFPPALPGTHLRVFDDGRVRLTLVLDDVESALRRLEATADAIYLDGFAPARNPEMWSARVLRGVARHSRRGATVATWSAARSVHDGLREAGFDVERRDGFGAKRDMLAGVYAPRGDAPGDDAHDGERHAIVVGAGLAGASAAASLAERGWRVTVVDAAPLPASGASSLLAGTFHPIVTRDDSLLARLTRAAFLHALDRWRDRDIAWARCGVLQLARRHVDEARFLSDAHDWPSSYVEAVDAAEGARRTGLPVERAGLWYADAGWARAPSIVASWLADSASTFVGGRRIATLVREGERWRADDDRGDLVAEAPIVVLANAADLGRLSPIGVPIASVRGQATYLPADALDAPRAVVIGHGYVLPAVDGRVVVGSSYDLESYEPRPDVASNAGNLARLRALAPALQVDVDASALDGGVGFRAVVGDRMPLVGALPDLAPHARGDRIATRPGVYAIGAFGSRGLTFAALAGAILAARIDGGPLPVESDLAAAIDPCRFVRRARRRGAS